MIGNSIRSIWNGDFVLANKEYFAHYLGKYYGKTGNLLPNNIIKQGFSKSLIKGNLNSLSTIFQAEALVVDNIVELFEEISEIKWVTHDDNESKYQKMDCTDEENTENNLKMKSNVVEYLLEHKKFSHLKALSNSIGNSVLLSKVQISLAKLLLPTEKSSATKILKIIDLSQISDELYFRFISFCTDYLPNEEIIDIFIPRTIHPLKIHEELINKESGLPFNIHKDIIDLFEILKPIWIFQPETIDQLLLKVSILPNPSKDIYNSIFRLSELWNKERTSFVSDQCKVDTIKQALKDLYVKRPKDFHKSSFGLFDSPFEDSLISSKIHQIYSTVFQYALKTLTTFNIKELIEYWLLLEDSDDGFRYYKISLEVAKIIQSSTRNILTDQIFKIIQHSEKIVRYEQETGTLLSFLGEVSEVYGICGFREDFERIYNQLIEIAFGVAYRKDYQASYIITPLEIIHKTDPKGTLNRLKEVFTIQNKLADAGNGRMHHICLSELIAFTAKYYPQLAFSLLEQEDHNIDRAEALDIIIEPLIKESQKEYLPILFSLIKTLPRWDKGGARDNYFLSLSETLLERAIQLKDDNFITVLLVDVKYNIIVELEDNKELEKFSKLLVKYGKDLIQYNLPQPNPKDEINNITKKLSQGEKFSYKYTPPIVNTLITLFEKDYTEFKKFIQSEYTICSKNRRNETFRNEYYRSKSTFEKFYQPFLEGSQLRDSINPKTVIRYYLELKNEVVNHRPEDFLRFTELEEFFNSFVHKTNNLFLGDVFETFIEKNFDKRKWIENILQFINTYREFVFSSVVSENDLFYIIEEVSILVLENLIDFINKWTSGRTNAIAMLKIANRLFNIERLVAKDILLKLADNENDNLLFPRKDESILLNFDIIETCIRNEPDFGKKLLLQSYLSQKARYGDNFIGSIDNLLKYESFFVGENSSYAYFEANLLYNIELSTGLPEKECKYDFISQHQEELIFPEIIIKHLIYLLDYPVIKIRQLTLQSLFDLVINDSNNYLELVITYGLINGTDNQVEYTLILLNALALMSPERLYPFYKELFKLTNKNHFNILELVKELLLKINNLKVGILSSDELNILRSLNTESPIQYPLPFVNILKGKNFLFSKHQSSLIYQIFRNEEDDTSFHDDIYTNIVNKGLKDYSPDYESSVHKRYNINTNFDTIEINSPYYEEIKSSINRIFNSKIKRGCFEFAFVENIKPQFRLHDPSKLLYKNQLRPIYINWLPESITENDFLKFSDFDDLMVCFANREDDYTTLFEYGSQRSDSKNQFKTSFEVFAYLKKKGFDDSVLDNYNFEPFCNR